MLSEHLIYNIAIAILIYTIYEKRYVLSIIILSAYSPDIDYVVNSILKKIGITLLIYGDPIKHGDFHNVLVLLIYAILVALLLNTIKIKMIDSFILASIGFTAHLFEDYIVFNPGYRFFWPISDKIYGIGLIKYKADFYGIANTEVLIIGLVIIFLSLIIYYMRRKIMRKFMIITDKMMFNIKNIYEPIIQFLSSLSEIIIICIDIILDRFGISDGMSEYMERDRKGIINSIMKSVIIVLSLIIFIVPMLVVVSWLFMEDKLIKR